MFLSTALEEKIKADNIEPMKFLSETRRARNEFLAECVRERNAHTLLLGNTQNQVSFQALL